MVPYLLILFKVPVLPFTREDPIDVSFNKGIPSCVEFEIHVSDWLDGTGGKISPVNLALCR